MKKIDEHYIAIAIAWSFLGLAVWIVADLNQSQTLIAASSYALGTAFPLSAFAGLTFRFFPAMKLSKFAKPQFWALSVGLALIVFGGFFASSGEVHDFTKFGLIVALCAMGLLALIFWRERTPAG